MRNCHLSFQMTGAAQRDEVSRVISHVGNQVFPSAFDVVDVQTPPTPAFFCSTEAANFISIENRKTKPPPVRSEFEAATASVILVCRANGGPLSADVRTKPPAAAYFAGERAKQFSALPASELRRRHETSVPAFPGAMTDDRVFVFEHPSAYGARNRFSGVLQAICGMARLAAKSKLRLLLHKPLKTLVAIGALERRAINHRRGVTSLAAEDRGRVVGLKLLGTLGAILEHH